MAAPPVALLLALAGAVAGTHETLCTSDACFTLHYEEVSFRKANDRCHDNGGYLMTVRDRKEEEALRRLLSLTPRTLRVWIGLKLNQGDCKLAGKPLRGFNWVSGPAESGYSNWEREPTDTCKERCVSVGHPDRLGWTDRACRTRTSYACKFYFQGMCGALELRGPGNVTYIPPFSEDPLRPGMDYVPLATYAYIVCGDRRGEVAICVTRGDSYGWNVPGPFCGREGVRCAVGNGGCAHLCRDGECACAEGYALEEDGASCRADPCASSACEHRCVAEESGGVVCACPEGFRLHANLRNCTDVDECRAPVCAAAQVCVNTQGGYRCACAAGYQMVDGECVDVDECALSRCEHGCLNTIGSFACFCWGGFAPSDDGITCSDVDECASGPCTFACVNTVGGFSCACPDGRPVLPDDIACDPEGTNFRSNVTEEEGRNSTWSTEGTNFRSNVTEEVGRNSTWSTGPTPGVPLLVVGNATQDEASGNTSMSAGVAVTAVSAKVLICVLGTVVPMLLLIAVTVAIAIFRCARSRQEAKKKNTADGYCWVPSGLDPRLEKLYASVPTDDL